MMVIDGQPWRYWGKWWSSTGSPHFWTSTSMTLPLRFLKWAQVKTYHYYNWRKPHPLASYFRVLTHDQVKNNSTYSKICSSGEREREREREDTQHTGAEADFKSKSAFQVSITHAITYPYCCKEIRQHNKNNIFCQEIASPQILVGWKIWRTPAAFDGEKSFFFGSDIPFQRLQSLGRTRRRWLSALFWAGSPTRQRGTLELSIFLCWDWKISLH